MAEGGVASSSTAIRNLKGFSTYVSMGLDEELLEAAERGDARKVRELLERGANPNTRDEHGRTPLHAAAYHGHAEVARLLLEHGADVNARNDIGYTPLHAAAYYGHVDVVRPLLDKGADVNARAKDGLTPLHLAAFHGHAKVAGLLLDRGADVNAGDVIGGTPLHDAAARGHLDVVKLLLDRGANVNARNEDGSTPLHLAAAFGQLDVAMLLLEHGADAGARDYYGLTPADLARRLGFKGIAEFIDSWARWGAGQAARGRVEGAEQVVHVARSRVEVLGVEQGLLRVGEWGVLKVVLKGVGGVKLSVEGDLDCMCEDSYNVDGEATVEVYVKPRASGTVPVKIVAECSGVKSSKLFLLNIEKNVCPNCNAPVEPGAKYCWRCGAKLE